MFEIKQRKKESEIQIGDVFLGISLHYKGVIIMVIGDQENDERFPVEVLFDPEGNEDSWNLRWRLDDDILDYLKRIG